MQGLHLEDFEDTSAAVCFLCRSCDKTLTNILELEERLSHMKEKVKSFISSFKSLIQESRERTATAKRTVPSALCNASSPKRICLDPTQQNSFQSSSPAVKVVVVIPYLLAKYAK